VIALPELPAQGERRMIALFRFLHAERATAIAIRVDSDDWRTSELAEEASLISGTGANGQSKPSLNDPRLKDGASLPSACGEELT
jgi:hypothetical protein